MSQTSVTSEDKENNPGTLTSKIKNKLHLQLEENLLNCTDDMLQLTNTSFGTLEKMCEKTASDPNSSLFQYLVDKKSRSAHVPTSNEEEEALERLLNELKIDGNERNKFQENLTLLESVEPPSRFWDSIIPTESVSPVKMVGLLRQSTIYEENSDNSTCETSSTSYKSAGQDIISDVVSSYDTANETSESANIEANKKKVQPTPRSTWETLKFPTSHPPFFGNDEHRDVGKPTAVINLDDSFITGDTKFTSPNPSNLNEEWTTKDEYSCDETKCLLRDKMSDSVIELSDEDIEYSENKLCTLVKLSPQTNTEIEGSLIVNSSGTTDEDFSEKDESLCFNDTMEEVDYMMKKGMEYLQKINSETAPAKSYVSPLKKKVDCDSSSTVLPNTPSTVRAVRETPKTTSKVTLNIKPFPKIDLFSNIPSIRKKSPLPSSSKKYFSSLQKQKYAHVVSPIGEYIKKTPKSPFLKTIKTTADNPSMKDNVFRKLEFDSRVCHNVSPTVHVSPEKTPINVASNQLPRKAYFSSERKHFVDERTKVTIPGGHTVQRYLTPNLYPAVVRHDGKGKIPEDLDTSEIKRLSEPTSQPDSSAVDLSIMSGNISLYTIKDARKF